MTLFLSSLESHSHVGGWINNTIFIKPFTGTNVTLLAIKPGNNYRRCLDIGFNSTLLNHILKQTQWEDSGREGEMHKASVFSSHAAATRLLQFESLPLLMRCAEPQTTAEQLCYLKIISI